MRVFGHIHQILMDAGLSVGPAAQALDAQLAAQAQSAELLGQPPPRPLTPAEAQSAELQAQDPVANCVAERGGDPSFRDAGLPGAAETAELTAACEATEQGHADLPPRPEPIATGAVLDANAADAWQTDSLTARLTDAQMAGLDLSDRMALLRHIAHGARVDGEDEQTIIRLLANAPDPAAVLVELRADQSALFRQLDRVIDGDSYAEYRGVLRAAWFAALGPAEAAAAIQNPVTALPWADPGLISSLTGDGRVLYDQVEIGEDGLIHIEARVTRGPVAIPLKWPPLDPLAMVAVRYFADEADFEAGAGEVQYMPAVEFLGLYHKQVGQTRRQLLDLSLLGLGAMGVVGAGSRLTLLLSAVEAAIGAADIVIREHRAGIAASEGGQDFLDAWDRVMTLAAVYGIAQVARQLPELVRGARNAWQRASGQADGLDAAGRAAVEARLAELEAHVQQAQRASKLRQPKASPEAVDETKAALLDTRPHVRDTHFADRAAEHAPDTGRLPGGVSVPGLRKVVVVESMPGGDPVSKVEVFDVDGQSLGTIKSVKDGTAEVFKVPFEPSMRLKVTRADGSTVDWTSGPAPPEGLRLRIKANKAFRKNGFAGGHTREAWDDVQTIYGGVIRESGHRQIGFDVPGHGPIEVSQIRYEVKGATGWKPVAQPKTIFEGPGDHQLVAFEEYMTPYVADAIADAPDAVELTVSVPVLNRAGEPTDVRVHLIRRGGEDGQARIHSWWVDDASFGDARLTLGDSNGGAP